MKSNNKTKKRGVLSRNRKVKVKPGTAPDDTIAPSNDGALKLFRGLLDVVDGRVVYTGRLC